MYKAIPNYRFVSYQLDGNIILCEPEKNEQSAFKYQKCLAYSPTSQILLFANEEKQEVIVKHPIPFLKSEKEFPANSKFEDCVFDDNLISEVNYTIETTTRELKMTRLAYRDESPYYLKNYCIQDPQDRHFEWFYLLLKPMIVGDTFDHFITTIQDPRTLLISFLAVVKELQCIHLRGVLHGDIKEGNVLLQGTDTDNTGLKVHFIDFGASYHITSYKATVTRDQLTRYWSPERIRGYALAPSPAFNQDVYSLGYMFAGLIRSCPAVRPMSHFKQKFPTFFSQLKNSQSLNPEERPKLDDLITQLETDINAMP